MTTKLQMRAATALDMTHDFHERGPATFSYRHELAAWLDGAAQMSARAVTVACRHLENVVRLEARQVAAPTAADFLARLRANVDDWYESKITDAERRAASAAIWAEAKDAGLENELLARWRQWHLTCGR